MYTTAKDLPKMTMERYFYSVYENKQYLERSCSFVYKLAKNHNLIFTNKIFLRVPTFDQKICNNVKIGQSLFALVIFN